MRSTLSSVPVRVSASLAVSPTRSDSPAPLVDFVEPAADAAAAVAVPPSWLAAVDPTPVPRSAVLLADVPVGADGGGRVEHRRVHGHHEAGVPGVESAHDDDDDDDDDDDVDEDDDDDDDNDSGCARGRDTLT
jgi:hypothetical protein